MNTLRRIRAAGQASPWPAWLPLVALLALSLCAHACGGSEALPEGSEGTASAAGQGTQAMKVYLDPETGEFLEEPPPGAADENGGEARALPREPLEVLPSPVPDGGMMIKLDDRFRAEFKATVGPDGKVSTECAEAGAGPAE